MPAITSDHPSMSTLAEFALGKLDAPAADSVRNHLTTCPNCRMVVDSTPSETLMSLPRNAGARPGDTPSRPESNTLGTRQVPNAEFDETELSQELREHPRYRFIRKLGQGGMGAVYEAEHKIMERPVAVKVIAPGLVDSPDAIDRFRREVRAAAKLEHPNIVRAYDADMAGGSMLLAMELVKGRTLADLVKAKGPLPIAYACQCLRQAAPGLQHAADHGMVHRDIKPQNLMITDKGVVKILDFGLAKLVSERKSQPGGLTGKNMVMGTPEYMAPEQALNTSAADIRADVYALGGTLFYLLTGRPPFRGLSPMEILTKKVTDAPPRVTELRPDVPSELAELVDQLLAKDPAERPQTPKEVADALAAFAKAQPTAPPAQTPHRKWPLPAAIAAGVLLAIVLWSIVFRSSSTVDNSVQAVSQRDDEAALPDDEFDPPAVQPAAAPGPDLFQKGTVWKGTFHRGPLRKGDRPANYPIILTVLERDGNSFNARIEIKNPDTLRIVKNGKVKGATIHWSHTDVTPIQGRGPGMDNSGIIAGNRLTLFSQDSGGAAAPSVRTRSDLLLER